MGDSDLATREMIEDGQDGSVEIVRGRDAVDGLVPELVRRAAGNDRWSVVGFAWGGTRSWNFGTLVYGWSQCLNPTRGMGKIAG